LISAGTAICGGNASAAVGPIAEASEEEMAASLGTVFILNSAALLLFPMIGLAVHMSRTQFGLWSALAIHDTSSVVKIRAYGVGGRHNDQTGAGALDRAPVSGDSGDTEE
jgi:uncharacterized membrane protein YadS